MRQNFCTTPWVHAGKMPAQPAIQADVGLVLRHRPERATVMRPLPCAARPNAPSRLPHLAFKAAVLRLVKIRSRHAIRKVVLAGERIRRLMVVVVAGAVAELLHELRRRIQNMRRRHQAAGLPRAAPRRAERRRRRRSISARCRDKSPPAPSPIRPPGCRAAHTHPTPPTSAVSACGSASPTSSAANRTSRRAM